MLINGLMSCGIHWALDKKGPTGSSFRVNEHKPKRMFTNLTYLSQGISALRQNTSTVAVTCSGTGVGIVVVGREYYLFKVFFDRANSKQCDACQTTWSSDRKYQEFKKSLVCLVNDYLQYCKTAYSHDIHVYRLLCDVQYVS